MGVYALIFRGGVEWRTRYQACLNALCSLYMILLVTVVTGLSFFSIVPECYKENQYHVILHRLAIGYSLMCTFSHYVTCVLTDASAKRTPEELLASRDSDSFAGSNLDASKTGAAGKAKDVTNDTVNANGANDSKLQKRSVSSTKHKETKTWDRSAARNGRNQFFCSSCKMMVGDRVHHCYLCETCIEKRDHHCFFMGICVGDKNQKYFIYFTLFMGIGTLYGLALIVKYLHVAYSVQFSGPQTFLTLFVGTMEKVFTGQLTSSDFLLHFFCMYACLIGTMFAFTLFIWQIMIVYYGQTTYEARRGITNYSKETVLENFADVFGANGVRSLVVPFIDLRIRR